MSGLLRWNRSSHLLLLVFLSVASRNFTTEGAVTQKLDGSTSPPAVLKPDCIACSSCENPCEHVLPPPPPLPPPPSPPALELLPPPKKPTFYCPPPPFYYQFGQPGSLYPYKQYDYTFSGSQSQMQGLPLAMVLIVSLLSYWCL